MFTRRAALMGAAMIAAAPYVVRPAAAQEEIDTAGAPSVDLTALPRREVKLLVPPMVHPHEQVASVGPSVVAFEMKIR